MIRKRKIIIALCVLTVGVLVIGVLIIGALGYILFFRDANETSLAKTDAGEPIGVASSRRIGPEGGSISSPDGRFTVTIPPGAIVKPLDVSIQPITDKSPGGLGHGYRVAPDGVIFDVPVTVRFTFDDRDWPGELPDDMDIAFQANDGTWQTFNSTMRDQTSRSVTVSTTHFTDYTAVYPWTLVPNKAKVHVREKIALALYYCGKRRSAIDKLLSLSEECVPQDGRHNVYNWSVNGVDGGNAVVGTAYLGNQDAVTGGTYVAPAKKPNPSEVVVRGDVIFLVNYYTFTHPTHWVFSLITIVGGGYTATGSEGPGPTTYSGTVCSLDKEFTVIGHNGPLDLTFKFTPSGDGRDGTGTLAGTAVGTHASVTWTGGGSYKVEGFDSEKPKIVFVTHQTVSSLTSGSGTFNIDLVPLDKECGGG